MKFNKVPVKLPFARTFFSVLAKTVQFKDVNSQRIPKCTEAINIHVHSELCDTVGKMLSQRFSSTKGCYAVVSFKRLMRKTKSFNFLKLNNDL